MQDVNQLKPIMNKDVARSITEVMERRSKGPNSQHHTTSHKDDGQVTPNQADGKRVRSLPGLEDQSDPGLD